MTTADALRRRFAAWVAVVACLFVGEIAWMVLLRGNRILRSDVVLIGGQAVLVALVLLIALLLRTTPPDAIKLRRGASEAIILLGAALLQVAAVALLRPALSEDVLRYRVDGRTWLAGLSPYSTAPVEFAESDAVDRMVRFPNLRTIYPAASQAAFVTAAAVERMLGGDADAVTPAPPGEPSPWRWYLDHAARPYRATVFRALVAAGGVLAVAVTLLLLRSAGQSPWWAAVLAWNPLFVLETGGMGHPDALGAMFALLALLALARKRPASAGASLALAAAVKPLALLLLPFILRDADRRRRLACVFATVFALLYVPPMLYRNGYAGWHETARTYSTLWEANGLLYELITRTFGAGDEGRAMARAKEMARLTAAAAVIAVGVVLWQRRAGAATAGYSLCLTSLLVSPVVYPWYLIWVLAFVPVMTRRVGWAGLVWSGTIAVSYLLWRASGWKLSESAMLLEYAPVYAAVGLEIAGAIGVARALDPRAPLRYAPERSAAEPGDPARVTYGTT